MKIIKQLKRLDLNYNIKNFMLLLKKYQNFYFEHKIKANLKYKTQNPIYRIDFW
jgi:hypothetical protein